MAETIIGNQVGCELLPKHRPTQPVVWINQHHNIHIICDGDCVGHIQPPNARCTRLDLNKSPAPEI